MSDAPELKPCPFCGSARVTVWNIRDGQQAVCKDCKAAGAATHHGPDRATNENDTWERAVVAWNRRTGLPPTRAEALEVPEVKVLVVAVTPLMAMHLVHEGQSDPDMLCLISLETIQKIRSARRAVEGA